MNEEENKDKKLSKIFNLDDEDEEINLPTPIMSYDEYKEVLKDLEKIQENLQNITKLSQMGISNISDLASQSQDDKMYHALAKMIQAGLNANKMLAEFHKLKMDIKPTAPDNITNINNTLVLTTTDLQKLLQDKNKEEDGGI